MDLPDSSVETLMHLSDIPPLELNSTQDSVTGSEEFTNSSLDIDLRDTSFYENKSLDEINLSESYTIHQAQSTEREIGETEGYSDRMSSRNTFHSTFSESELFTLEDNTIMIGNRVLGRLVKPVSQAHQIQNFVSMNKHSGKPNMKGNNYSYGGLHRLKVNSSRNNSRFSKKPRSLMSHPESLDHGCCRDSTNYTKQLGSNSDGLIDEKLVELSESQQGTDFSIGSGDEQYKIHKLRSISSNNIIEQGLKEQFELLEAYKQFFNNRGPANFALSGNLKQSTLLSASVGNLISSHSVTFGVNQSAQSIHSTQSGFPPIGSTRSPASIKRYTLRDYTQLPRLESRPRSLGPDLNSEDYKNRLQKKQRQMAYAELLRTRTKRQGGTGSRSPSNPSRTVPRRPRVPREEPEQENAEQSIAEADGSSRQSEKLPSINNLDSALRPRRSRKEVLTVNHRQAGTKNPSPTKEEQAYKRSLMLDYGKHIREQMKKQAKRMSNPCPVAPDSDQSSTSLDDKQKTNELIQTTAESPVEARLEELLKRFNEERETVEEIRRSLKQSS